MYHLNGEARAYSFFQHRACEFFPCHAGVEEKDFNCLFCYCPLYLLGRGCGGSFSYNEKGDKVCTGCAFPHRRENYDAVLARYGDIREMLRRNDCGKA